MSQGGAKASLAIAIRYAMTRLTVGPKGKSDFPIMKYQLQANAIAPLLARTISLGVALDQVKDEWFAIQQEQSTDSARITELVTACCVIKPLCSWNLERVASIMRERCGGAGYLSCSRFGTFIGLAHAAMTAEGDNSVLMNKVANEQLKFIELGKTMMAAGRQGLFDAWSLANQDLVQAAAHAYGERIVSDALNKTIDNNADVAVALDLVYRLHAVNTIQNNLPSLMIANVISTENAAQVKAEFNNLSTQVAAISPELIGAFGIPEELLSAPIARDWQEFNQYDNRGEVQAGVF